MISEIALALVLLIGAGLLIRSFTVLQRWDPGFETDGLATAWLLAPAGKFETDQDVTSFFREARARLATLPSVLSTGTASAGPAFGGGDGSDAFFPEGEPAVDAAGHPANWFDVGPGYFETMGIPIILGRAFTDDDDHDSPRVVMVNETMARRLWPGESPLGRLVRQKGIEAPREVVGVVADVRPFDPDAPMRSEIYWPQAQSVRFATYVILRTSSSPETLLRPIEDRLRAFDSDLRVSGFATMDDLVARQLVRPRFNMTLIGAFGILSLILSAVGTYGVVSRSVTSRTREIGVRMALGARRTQVLGGVVREGMALGILGVLLGIGMALGLTRLLTGMLHGIVPTDVLTFSTVSGTLLVVTLLSCLIPAIRASRVDPLSALRDD